MLKLNLREHGIRYNLFLELSYISGNYDIVHSKVINLISNIISCVEKEDDNKIYYKVRFNKKFFALLDNNFSSSKVIKESVENSINQKVNND